MDPFYYYGAPDRACGQCGALQRRRLSGDVQDLRARLVSSRRRSFSAASRAQIGLDPTHRGIRVTSRSTIWAIPARTMPQTLALFQHAVATQRIKQVVLAADFFTFRVSHVRCAPNLTLPQFAPAHGPLDRTATPLSATSAGACGRLSGSPAFLPQPSSSPCDRLAHPIQSSSTCGTCAGHEAQRPQCAAQSTTATCSRTSRFSPPSKQPTCRTSHKDSSACVRSLRLQPARRLPPSCAAPLANAISIFASWFRLSHASLWEVLDKAGLWDSHGKPGNANLCGSLPKNSARLVRTRLRFQRLYRDHHQSPCRSMHPRCRWSIIGIHPTIQKEDWRPYSRHRARR